MGEGIFEGFGGQFKKMDINDPRLDTPESIKKVVMDIYNQEEERKDVIINQPPD